MSPDSSIVTEADLAIIRNLRLPSGYHGVYHRGSRWPACWRAQPCSSRRGGCVQLGSYPHPREAAKAVVRWWKAQFGDEWVTVFQRRKWIGRERGWRHGNSRPLAGVR